MTYLLFQNLGQMYKSAKKKLDYAIYGLKDPEVVNAFKSVADKMTLRIAYDGGKQKELRGEPSVDPKLKVTSD